MIDGVRFAETEQELCASYKLRYKIYVEAMGRFKDKSDHVFKELRDAYDEDARAVIAVKNGSPIGTLRLFWGGDEVFDDAMVSVYRFGKVKRILEDKQICIIERLMVDENYRGSTVSLRLYQQVMKFVLDYKVEAVLILCEPHHMNSYLKLGFCPFENISFYSGIGSVIPMLLNAGDYEHLKKVGSPFSRLITKEDIGYCRHVNELQELIKGGESNVVSFSKLYEKRLKVVKDFVNPQNRLQTELFRSRLKMRLSA